MSHFTRFSASGILPCCGAPGSWYRLRSSASTFVMPGTCVPTYGIILDRLNSIATSRAMDFVAPVSLAFVFILSASVSAATLSP